MISVFLEENNEQKMCGGVQNQPGLCVLEHDLKIYSEYYRKSKQGS